MIKNIIQNQDFQKGRIHSIESLATLDGPGLRTVVFFQGCPLKCLFCHNIDSTLSTGGTQYTVRKLVDQLLQYKSYWNKDGHSNGGITISGGDSILQPIFLQDLVKELKGNNVNIAIDTSLYTSQEIIYNLCDSVDLWMVSVKHMNSDIHKHLTGVKNEMILKNIIYLDQTLSKMTAKKIRIRLLVIPGLTDTDRNIEQTIAFISHLRNLESIELLAYSDIGKFKWIEIFGKYELEEIRNCEKKDLERVKERIKNQNSNIEIII